MNSALKAFHPALALTTILVLALDAADGEETSSAGQLGVVFAQGVVKVEKDVTAIFEHEFTAFQGQPKEIGVEYEIKASSGSYADAKLIVSGPIANGWEGAYFAFHIRHSRGKWSLVDVTRETIDDTGRTTSAKQKTDTPLAAKIKACFSIQ